MKNVTRVAGIVGLAVIGIALAAGAGLWASERRVGSGVPSTGAGGSQDRERFAYHLRVVRVTGTSALRGAAYKCGRFCGTPIVLPDEEAWGTPAQLDALAHLLGGERADAVTGFIVVPDGTGESRFEGTIYLGETWAELKFAAEVPAETDGLHEISLKLDGPVHAGGPLAEARLLVGSERTVAIAAPSPIDDEWIAVAVTPMDPAAARERIERAEKIEVLSAAPGVEPPTRIRKVDPEFPEGAKKERRSGRILLQAVIDAEGFPRAVQVLRVPPGCEDMASAAVEAVRQWRYEPATSNGRPVPVYFTIQVEFTLS
jgi:TonB family protein